MKECFQFKTMSMLDHGEDVRSWYEDLQNLLMSSPRPSERRFAAWKLPSWIESNVIRQHFLTADDEVIRLYQVYHDCGKHLCREVDAEERQHFPNHAAVSKQRWLDCGGSAEVGDLIGMDMDVHQLKACDVEEFAARPQALTLLLTGLCELHSNAQMFGGIDSTGFKIKFKNLERFGKRIIEACEGKVLYHYVISRRDLPLGNQLAQAIHAAGESATPRPQPGCRAVALHAADETHLKIIAARLDKADIRHHCVYESDDDAKYPSQLMSIGVPPTSDRDKLRKVLGSLPLAK
jgi:hypothetical protein